MGKKSRKTKNPTLAWGFETGAIPLHVRGAYPVAPAPPILWLDATDRPDVRDLPRAHGESSEGSVTTRWGTTFGPGAALELVLLVRFRRPVRCAFGAALRPEHGDAVAGILQTGQARIVTEEPRLEGGAIEARNAIAIDVDVPGLRAMLAALPRLRAIAEAVRGSRG